MTDRQRNFARIVVVGALAGAVAAMAHFFIEAQVKRIT